MKKCIWRDDDLSFRSDLKEFEALIEISSLYGPISVAFVPNISDDADVGYCTKNSHLDYNNFQRYILDGKVQLLMHGIQHTFENNEAEFERNVSISHDALLLNKSHLEQVFKVPISTFVPPHNSISKSNYFKVSRIFRNLSTSFCHRPSERPLTAKHNYKLIKCASKIALYGNKVKSYQRCWVPLNDNGLTEYESVGLIPKYGIDNLQLAFDHYCRAKTPQAPFCFNTHYWELTSNMLDDIKYFLKVNKLKLCGFPNV